MHLLNRKICLLTAILNILLLSESLYAGSDFYAFLEEPTVSSLTGMGSAGTSSGMGGFTFYNPAGLALRDKSLISFDFTRIDDFGRGYIESGWVFPTWFIGGSFQTQSIDDVQRTDLTGILDGAFAPVRGTMLSILTGIKRERYSLGVVLNGVQEVIGDYKSYGFSGSVGLLVHVVPDHITMGISGIHAAGRHNSFLDGKEKLKSERFPATVRAGVSLKDSLLRKFPATVSVDVVYNDNDEIVTVPVGVDFRILPPLSVRIGKRFNYKADLFSLGVGLQWKNIAFDASFTPYKLVSDHFLKRSVGLTYFLPSRRSSAEGKKVSMPKAQPAKKSDNAVIEVIPQEVPVPEVQKDSVVSDTISNEQHEVITVTDTLSEKNTVDSIVSNNANAPEIPALQRSDTTAVSGSSDAGTNGKIIGSTQPAADSSAIAPVNEDAGKETSPVDGSVVKTAPDTGVVPARDDTLKKPDHNHD